MLHNFNKLLSSWNRNKYALLAIYEQLNLGAYQHDSILNTCMPNVHFILLQIQFLEKLAELLHKRSLRSCYIVNVYLFCYGLKACPLNISDFRSLNFVTDRFFMKLLKTNNINTVRLCQKQFGSVQRRFTKRLPTLRNMSYNDRLRYLNIGYSLELRRLHTDLFWC